MPRQQSLGRDIQDIEVQKAEHVSAQEALGRKQILILQNQLLELQKDVAELKQTAGQMDVSTLLRRIVSLEEGAEGSATRHAQLEANLRNVGDKHAHAAVIHGTVEQRLSYLEKEIGDSVDRPAKYIDDLKVSINYVPLEQRMETIEKLIRGELSAAHKQLEYLAQSLHECARSQPKTVETRDKDVALPIIRQAIPYTQPVPVVAPVVPVLPANPVLKYVAAPSEFDQIDTNHDGVITRAEWTAAKRGCGCTSLDTSFGTGGSFSTWSLSPGQMGVQSASGTPQVYRTFPRVW